MPNLSRDTKLTIGTVIVAALTVFGFTLRFMMTSVSPFRAHPSVVVGMKISDPTGYKWRASNKTLLLVLSVKCPHCENEVPFYERLLALKQHGQIGAQILAYFPFDSGPQVNEGFSRRLVALHKFSGTEMEFMRVEGTPTILIVDQNGIVKSKWVGELSDSEKEEVIRELDYTPNGASVSVLQSRQSIVQGRCRRCSENLASRQRG